MKNTTIVLACIVSSMSGTAIGTIIVYLAMESWNTQFGTMVTTTALLSNWPIILLKSLNKPMAMKSLSTQLEFLIYSASVSFIVHLAVQMFLG
jgi:hypothetical protein